MHRQTGAQIDRQRQAETGRRLKVYSTVVQQSYNTVVR